MGEYDTTLKSVLTRLTASGLERWHNVELPAVRHRRADLLGEGSDGRLIHIELQSTNQAHMARRMLEYSLAIHRTFRRFPEQIVLYVGNAPLSMKGHLAGPGLSFDCRIVDMRDIDGEPLLASPRLEDNILALLTGVRGQREAVRRILVRIAASEPAERGAALAELLVLAGLRRLATVIEREIQQMPILDDIMDHEVIGRERKRGIALGREEGERSVILCLIDKRFGAPPDWVKQRLDTLTSPDLEQIALRLLDARSLEELFA